MQSTHSVAYYKTQSTVIHRYIYTKGRSHCDNSDSSKAIRVPLVCKTSQVADKGQQTPKGTSLEAHFSQATLHPDQTLMLLAIPASRGNIDRGC